jgi:tRNA (mo5U34)-methyltransferase
MTATAHGELVERIQSIEWYHTLELAPGVVTPGWLDHRSVLPKIPMPGSLHGKRCLDVGTFNGFWAFEMERRGGEVTAVDVLDPYSWDWPAGSDAHTLEVLARRQAAGDGFELAHAALDSSVKRIDCSVYDLDPDAHGSFDVVYVGSLLVHLRDPVRALERARAVCRDDGVLVLVEGFDLLLTLRCPRAPVARFDGAGRPWWWYANPPALAGIVAAAGFELVSEPRRLYIPPGAGNRIRRSNLRGLFNQAGRHMLLDAWIGDPHVAIVARPRR